MFCNGPLYLWWTRFVVVYNAIRIAYVLHRSTTSGDVLSSSPRLWSTWSWRDWMGAAYDSISSSSNCNETSSQSTFRTCELKDSLIYRIMHATIYFRAVYTAWDIARFLILLQFLYSVQLRHKDCVSTTACDNYCGSVPPDPPYQLPLWEESRVPGGTHDFSRTSPYNSIH